MKTWINLNNNSAVWRHFVPRPSSHPSAFIWTHSNKYKKHFECVLKKLATEFVIQYLHALQLEVLLCSCYLWLLFPIYGFIDSFIFSRFPYSCRHFLYRKAIETKTHITIASWVSFISIYIFCYTNVYWLFSLKLG